MRRNTVCTVISLMVTGDPDALVSDLVQLFLAKDVVILARIAGLVVQLGCLVAELGRNSPHALTHALVSFSVLLDTLLYLALIQTQSVGSTASAITRAGVGMGINIRWRGNVSVDRG